jgi:hypothetical protein
MYLVEDALRRTGVDADGGCAVAASDAALT